MSKQDGSQSAGKKRYSVGAPKVKSVAGVIERIELTNFMCHSNLAVDFNPQVNFIVGRNGSGKSAIMSGIQVALGLKATETARGKKILDLLKRECNQGKVRITLSNVGIRCYKPEKYGQKIILTKTINRKGAHRLTIENGIGKTANCSRAELKEIMENMHICAANPFALMAQETVKTFLRSEKKDGRNMYTLIEEGTGIAEIKRKLSELKAKNLDMAEKEKSMRNKLTALEDNLKSWKSKQKMVQKADQAQGLLDQLHLEEAWVGVQEMEAEVNQLKKDLQRVGKVTSDHEKAMGNLEAEKAELQVKIRNAELDHQNAKTLYSEKKHERDAVMEKHQVIVSHIDGLKQEMRGVERTLKCHLESKKVLVEAIRKITSHSVDEELKKRAQRLAKIEEQKAELGSTQSNLQMIEGRLEEQRHVVRNMEQELSTAKGFYNSKTNEARQIKQDLDRMSREASSLPPAYGNRMTEFRAEVDREAARKGFKHKPIGPIGLEVKLHDYSWSLAVENYLRGEMKTFFCDNFEDRKKLDAISKRVLGHSVQCVVSKFIEQPFNVHSKKAIAPHGLMSLMDVLDVKDTRVFNYLVDQRRIDGILLCEDTTHALNLMQRGDSVPQRSVLVLTKDAEQVFPYPNFKVYGKEHEVEFLVKSREAGMAGLEQRLQAANELCQTAKSEFQQIEAQHSSAREEVASLNSQRQKLQQKANQLSSALRQAADEQDLGTVDNFATLTEELNDIDEQIELANEEKQQSKDDISERDVERKQLESELITLAAEFKVLKDKHGESELAIRESMGNLDELEVTAESRKKRHTENLQRQKEAEANLAKKRAELEASTAVAAEVGPRADHIRARATVQKEIAKQQNNLQRMRSNLEPTDLIEETVQRLSEQYADDSASVKIVKESYEEMVDVLKSRTTFYNNTAINTFSYVKQFFQNLFGDQPIQGELDVEMPKRTVSVRSSFKGVANEAAKNLSGGEGSFTTVALVIAVWDKLLVPFYMYDEFDVFMDMTNRRRAMDMLLQEAKGKPGMQFFFITPLDTNLKSSPSITIHKLAPAQDE